LKIELPVRSAVLKQDTGGLVVRWVTTGEYPLLYVFGCVFAWRRDRRKEGGREDWMRKGRIDGTEKVIFGAKSPAFSAKPPNRHDYRLL
jgi:hypothetical protein